jgi:hypothetical protein
MQIPALSDEQSLLDAYVPAALTAINERSGSIGDDVLALRASVTDYSVARDLIFPVEPFECYAYLDEPDDA